MFSRHRLSQIQIQTQKTSTHTHRHSHTARLSLVDRHTHRGLQLCVGVGSFKTSGILCERQTGRPKSESTHLFVKAALTLPYCSTQLSIHSKLILTNPCLWVFPKINSLEMINTKVKHFSTLPPKLLPKINPAAKNVNDLSLHGFTWLRVWLQYKLLLQTGQHPNKRWNKSLFYFCQYVILFLCFVFSLCSFATYICNSI